MRESEAGQSPLDPWVFTPPSESFREFWIGIQGYVVELGQGWVFRGVSDAGWRLSNTLQRLSEIVPLKDHSDAVLRDLENQAVGYFKRNVAAIPIVERLPDDDDILGWLSLMRHYGAPCRLLDWTRSFLIACYFAFRSPRDCDAAIWCINAVVFRRLFGYSSPAGPDHVGLLAHTTTLPDGTTRTEYPGIRGHTEQRTKVIRHAIAHQIEIPLPLQPDRWNSRLVAQQGLFTFSGRLDRTLEQLTENWPPRVENIWASDQWIDSASSFLPLSLSSGGPDVVIRKIILPRRFAGETLATLYSLNINAQTLFPGLDGLGEATSEAARFGVASYIDALE